MLTATYHVSPLEGSEPVVSHYGRNVSHFDVSAAGEAVR